VPTNPVFSPTDPNSFNWSSSQEIFSGVTDDVSPHTLKLYFAKTAVPNTWNVYSSIDDVVSPTAQPVTFTPGGLLSTGGTFSSTGSVTANVETADPLTGTITTTATVVPMTIAIDLGASTQFGAGFDQAKSEQDGYKDGRLAGTSLALDGTIVGNYSNGKSQNIARVALATFINPNGLKSIGDNLWLESTQSGAANVGAAGANGRGILASNSLERSGWRTGQYDHHAAQLSGECSGRENTG
jgi:flagellar hook protein FlgE